MKLTFVTPEKKILEHAEALEVTVPAHKGELNILPGHAPMLTTLGAGVLKYKLAQDPKYYKYSISWGYCHVSAIEVKIMTEIAKSKEDIDVSLIPERMDTAMKRLAKEYLSDSEFNSIQQDIAVMRAEEKLSKEE